MLSRKNPEQDAEVSLLHPTAAFHGRLVFLRARPEGSEMKKSLSLDVSRLLGFKLVAGESNRKDALTPQLLCRDPRIGAKIGKPTDSGNPVAIADHRAA